MDLFEHADEARARDTDPDTSHDAAESISPRLRQLQADVLAFAAERAVQGFTHIDLNNHFRTTSSTYRTRCSELVDKGFIEDSGERHAYGPDGKGRRHVVWNITPAGAAEHHGTESPRPTDTDRPEVFERHAAWVRRQEGEAPFDPKDCPGFHAPEGTQPNAG